MIMVNDLSFSDCSWLFNPKLYKFAELDFKMSLLRKYPDLASGKRNVLINNNINIKIK